MWLSTPHGELETDCRRDTIAMYELLSTPHGELETEKYRIAHLPKRGLSTPHGELETPVAFCNNVSNSPCFQLHTVN